MLTRPQGGGRGAGDRAGSHSTHCHLLPAAMLGCAVCPPWEDPVCGSGPSTRGRSRDGAGPSQREEALGEVGL